jgi:hypothetical protein
MIHRNQEYEMWFEGRSYTCLEMLRAVRQTHCDVAKWLVYARQV